MPARALVLLALLAALLGAPSPASAAGNTLSAASVTPRTGSTATPFAFSVRYEGRFDAAAVVVSVGGETVPMALVAGSALVGTWAGTTTLPAGTWPVTFTATGKRGNAPALDGGSVTVDGPVATADDSSDGPNAGTGPTGARGGTPPEPVGSAPAGGPGAAVTSPVAAGEDPSTSSPGAGGEAGVPPVAPTSPQGGTPAGSVIPPAAATPHEGDAATDPDKAASTKSRTEASETTTAPVPFALLVGLSGVAIVGLLGSTLLLLVRRRQAGEPTTALADATAALERRAIRRAKMRLPEDPIVDSMGIDREPRRQRRRMPPT